jgi:hypothetical protein
MSRSIHYRQSESLLLRLRQRIFDFDDTPKEPQAARVLGYLKTRVLRGREIERKSLPVGPYSGLTRGELRATGSCEPDWY